MPIEFELPDFNVGFSHITWESSRSNGAKQKVTRFCEEFTTGQLSQWYNGRPIGTPFEPDCDIRAVVRKVSNIGVLINIDVSVELWSTVSPCFTSDSAQFSLATPLRLIETGTPAWHSGKCPGKMGQSSPCAFEWFRWMTCWEPWCYIFTEIPIVWFWGFSLVRQCLSLTRGVFAPMAIIEWIWEQWHVEIWVPLPLRWNVSLNTRIHSTRKMKIQSSRYELRIHTSHQSTRTKTAHFR